MSHKAPRKSIAKKKLPLPETPTPEIKTEAPPRKTFLGSRSLLCLSLFLALSCLTVYYNALSNDFVWDDRPLILTDRMIRDLHNVPQAFKRDFFDFTEEEDIKYGYFRPIVTISYMLDYTIWQENPFGFHLTNLILHIACTIFLFFIFIMLGVPRPVAFLGSLIFGVHPIHTESVAWISGRTDVLCCFFLLPALGCYIAYRNHSLPRTQPIMPRLCYFLSLIFYSLSLLSKEMGLVLIPILLVMEWLYFNKPAEAFRQGRIKRITPYLLLTAGYLSWHSMEVSRFSANRLKLDMLNLYPTILTAFKAFLLYVFKLLLPIQLSAYIKLPMLTGTAQAEGFFYFLVFAALCYIFIVAARHKALIGLSGGLFLVSMAPLLNIMRITSPVDMGFTMAERFMYIPSSWFILSMAITLNWGNELILKRYPSYSKLTVLLVAVMIGALGYRTILRNRDWRDDGTLFNAELAAHNESALIHSNLGKFYARQGKYEKALSQLKSALRLSPDTIGVLNNMGQILVDIGRFNEAIPYLKRAIELDPSKHQLHNNYGLAMAGLGHYREALKAYKIAQSIRPTSAQIYNNMGVAFKKLGDFQNALNSYQRAIKYDKYYAAPHKNLAILYMINLKKPGLALQSLHKSLQLDPGQPEAPSMKKLIKKLASP